MKRKSVSHMKKWLQFEERTSCHLFKQPKHTQWVCIQFNTIEYNLLICIKYRSRMELRWRSCMLRSLGWILALLKQKTNAFWWNGGFAVVMVTEWNEEPFRLHPATWIMTAHKIAQPLHRRKWQCSGGDLTAHWLLRGPQVGVAGGLFIVNTPPPHTHTASHLSD